ncbi:MAG: flagellar hook-basal body protein [Firmicutes bacterium]|nr:flagellar hook-basal body protein [Bacillota bacterium]
MMNGLNSAVSGLKAQQTALDVIANNISNVSTTGYKSQTVTFSDLLSQTISAASGATSTSAGTNATQVGLGVAVAGVSTDMSVGSTETTSDSMDVALSGDGFLIVTGGSEGEYQFTRDGNLAIDENGNLNVNGYEVCGWESSYTLDDNGNKVFTTTGEVEPINIYSNNNKIMAAEASAAADFSGGLDSSAEAAANATGMTAIGDTSDLTYDAASEITVYDAQGNSYDVTINWKKCAVESGITSWYWEADSSDASISPANGYVAFDTDGNMVTSATALSAAVDANTATDTTINTAGYAYSNISVGTGSTTGDYTITTTENTDGTWDVTLTSATDSTITETVSSSDDGSATFTLSDGTTVTLSAPTSLAAGTTTFTIRSNSYAFDETPSITVTPPTTAGTDPVALELDFAEITTTNLDDSDVTGSADGYASGTLQSLSISSDGTITGTYSNGETQSLAQLALAVFNNQEGLEKIGDNLYVSTTNSGSYNAVVAGTNGSGAMTSGALELSNVDLAAQFSAMMVSQRAYQANTKVISATDEMLQSLINMVG